jgi:hypothetical protein
MAREYYQRALDVADYRSRHLTDGCKASMQRFACYTVFNHCIPPPWNISYQGVCRYSFPIL